jgi:predicted nucleotidyltransferase component of viral defense system
MTVLPLNKRLKKKIHRDVAISQDLMLIEIYNCFSDAAVHGGTAIWRCYGSGRFSEDIDVYLPKKFRKSENVKLFLNSLENKGFAVVKFREKENSIFSIFSYMGVNVRFEAVFENKKNFIAKPFEMSDGTFINVYTFTPEDLIKEKIAAYNKRRKVRDLYDIFFLLKLIEKKQEIRPLLKEFVENFKKPQDAEDLKVLIISGVTPDVEDMLEEVKRWAE